MTAAAGPLVPGTGDAISPEQAGALTPGQARALFRDGLVTPTTGWSRGYVQANLVVLPRDWAFDMMLFARRNPAPVPLLDVTDPGSVSTALAPGADLRSDVPRYRVWRDGQLVDSPTDVTTLWREDLVAFLIGCSFTAEAALLRAGVPLRHLEQGRNVPMYTTAVPCEPAGRLAGPLVVSMRPLPAEFIGTAVEVTSRMPHAHGAPVHVGDPGTLGITDLSTPDFGDAVTPAPGDVPVFWACGVTPQAVLMQAAPPFAITHAPGHMFITDAPDDQHRMTSTDAPGEPDDPSRRTGGQR